MYAPYLSRSIYLTRHHLLSNVSGVDITAAVLLESSVQATCQDVVYEFDIQYIVEVNTYSIQFNSVYFQHTSTYHTIAITIMCRKRVGLQTVLMNVRPQTLPVVTYEQNYH